MEERIKIDIQECETCTRNDCRAKNFVKWLRSPERDLPTDLPKLSEDVRAFLGNKNIGSRVTQSEESIIVDVNNRCSARITLTPINE